MSFYHFGFGTYHFKSKDCDINKLGYWLEYLVNKIDYAEICINVDVSKISEEYFKFLPVAYRLCRKGKLNGFTFVISRDLEDASWSVCKKSDHFTKRFGELLALNRLCEKVQEKSGLTRCARFSHERRVYVVELKNNGLEEFRKYLEVKKNPVDIREEMSWYWKWEEEK